MLTTTETQILLRLHNSPISAAEMLSEGGWKRGSLYPLLKRMERSGLLVKVQDENRTKPGRPKRVLALTPMGLTAVLRHQVVMALDDSDDSLRAAVEAYLHARNN